MKQRVSVLFIVFIVVTITVGCGKQKSQEEELQDQLNQLYDMAANINSQSPFDNAPEGMKTVHELVNYLEKLQTPANKIDWFTYSGKAIDVEIEAEKFYQAYDEKDKYIEMADGLSDEYSIAKKAFAGAMEGYDQVAETLNDLDVVKNAEASGSGILPPNTTDYYNTLVNLNNDYLKELQQQ